MLLLLLLPLPAPGTHHPLDEPDEASPHRAQLVRTRHCCGAKLYADPERAARWEPNVPHALESMPNW